MQSQTNSVNLTISRIGKSYGQERVLRDITLAVQGGSILTLLGPSGCGKSTLLRIIAGFVNADEGDVLLNDQSILHLPPNRRETAMVFQNYTLFPHMRVIDNVMFGLKMRRVPRDQALTRAGQALEMVQLSQLGDRYPSQLSGGQMQRVALARALVTEPKILLLDEPFAALDKNLREDMQVELRKLQQALGLTMVCVTHDQREAMVISDYVSVMSQGRIVQFGTPLEIYDTPRNLFTAQFIGSSNILRAEVVQAQAGRAMLRLGEMPEFELATDRALNRGAAVDLAIKPRAFEVFDMATARAMNGQLNGHAAFSLPGEVRNCVLLGSSVSYEIRADNGANILAEVERGPATRLYKVGERVALSAPTRACVMLEDGSDA
ncbi:ABC transporter ATP-binding protein [Castellaniella sp.]|uniref:ABC transporter ATP-binding protein n=1 Tax=Castellaniella sp. TaxID=1955812 RepID=UPI00355CBE81